MTDELHERVFAAFATSQALDAWFGPGGFGAVELGGQTLGKLAAYAQ
jgi:uncharacterized protein YndB with AHSA1/START domain